MNPEEAARWQRISEFEIDLKESPFPFSARLAKENVWLRSYTLRVIEEYKRFAFLSAIASHPVSPSDAVDQAWHLHLLYTESYWKEFCPLLGKPLHHGPSKGSQQESAKFDDWYRRTLESYRQVFDAEPPTDIWTDPEAKLTEKHHFVRVDKASNWVIPRPKLRLRGRQTLFIALGIVAIGCSGAMAGGNPMDMFGPDFLSFYLLLFACCYVLALFLRWIMRQPSSGDPAAFNKLSGIEMAYLNGGGTLAANAAITELVAAGRMECNSSDGHLISKSQPLQNDPELKRNLLVWAGVPGGSSPSGVRSMVSPQMEALQRSLESRGLLVSSSKTVAAIAIPIIIGLIAPSIGLVKVAVGISRNRPAQLLLELCFVSLIVVVATFARRPFRSQYGDKVLGTLKKRFSTLRHFHIPNIPPEELVTGVALFGLSSLATTYLANLAMDLAPPQYQSGGTFYSGSNCSNGCNNSCGGGSGCSGGCGGGGGCGGCSS